MHGAKRRARTEGAEGEQPLYAVLSSRGFVCNKLYGKTA